MPETKEAKPEKAALPRIYEIRRVDRLKDENLQRLVDDFREAPNKYGESDAKELALRFVDAHTASIEKWDLTDAIDFKSATSDTCLGVVSGAEAAFAILSTGLESALNHKRDRNGAPSEDELWDILNVGVSIEQVGLFSDEIKGIISGDAATHDGKGAAFANAMLCMTIEMDRDAHSLLAGVLKKETELSKAACGSEKDAGALRSLKKSMKLTSELAEKNEEDVKESDAELARLRDSVLSMEGGRKALDWSCEFTGCVRERMTAYLSIKRKESDE